MALQYSILGLIDINPLSGYDIVKIYNYAVVFYWHATHTQIYRTLKKLEESGLLSSKTMPEKDGPSKKLYSITEEGKQSLQDWLNTTSELTSFKHSFLLKLSMSHNVDNDFIINQFQTYIDELEKKLLFLTSKEKLEKRSFARDEKEKLLWYLTEKNGQMYYENEIKWAKESLAAFREFVDAKM